MTDLFGGDLFL